MHALNCPQCGAHLELDGNREYGFCQYCGAKIDLISSRVKVSGNVALDRSQEILERAQALEKLDRRGEALEAYREMTQAYPSKWQGWWGVVVTTRNFNELDEAWESFKTMADSAKIAQMEPLYRLVEERMDTLAEARDLRNDKIKKYESALKNNEALLLRSEEAAPQFKSLNTWVGVLIVCLLVIFLSGLLLGSTNSALFSAICLIAVLIGIVAGFLAYFADQDLKRIQSKGGVTRNLNKARSEIAHQRQRLAELTDQYDAARSHAADLTEKLWQTRTDLR